MSHYEKYGHSVRQWQVENKEKYDAYQKEYRKKNKLEAYTKQRKLKEKLKKIIMSMIGDRCICCGCSDWWNLTVDHINPNTKNHIQKYTFYQGIIKGKIPLNELQMLCYGCNASKSSGSRCFIEH